MKKKSFGLLQKTRGMTEKGAPGGGVLRCQAGFTLIEMIAAIVIAAIIFAVAGLGIVDVTNGLLTSKQNASMALKAESAMLRLEKEFHIITAVSAGAKTELDYMNNRGGTDTPHVLKLSGNAIQLDGNTLINDVTDLTLSYGATYNGLFAQAWAAGDKVINLSFTLSGSGGSGRTFTMRVRSVNL